MCRAAVAAHSGDMNTDTVNEESTTTQSEPGSPNQTGSPHQYGTRPASPRQPLRRSYDDHILGGVAGGLARYFGVDATIVRIAFAVLVVFGGAGIPLYLAGLLLIPEEGSDQSIAGSLIESLQSRSR
jgi:phage shock protein PspC (stress-responsive transcriptional regulator)